MVSWLWSFPQVDRFFILINYLKIFNLFKMMPNMGNNPMNNQMGPMMGNQGMPISMANQPPMMNPNMMQPQQNPQMASQMMSQQQVRWN